MVNHAAEKWKKEFVREALTSDTSIEKDAAVYRAGDVHSWLERLAKNRKAARPKKPGSDRSFR